MGMFAVGVLSACGGGSDSERSAMSLDEYVAACGAPTTVDFDEDFDLEAFSTAVVAQIGVLESIDPPEEVAAWHDAMLAYLRALQDTLDDAPDGEGAELDEFLFGAVFSLAFEHGPALEGALGAMAPEVQEQLRAAGCLDDEESADFEDGELSDFDAEGVADVPAPAPARDPEPTTPAGSVTSFDEYAATCAAYAGEDIPDDATNGEVAAEMARSIQVMASIDPPPELTDLHESVLAYAAAIKDIADTQPQDEAANLFAYVIVLPRLGEIEAALDALDPEVRARLATFGCLGDGDGSSPEFGVPQPVGPPSPSNATYAVEGSAIRLRWDPVDGADYYNVYHDYFSDSSCWLDADGSPHGCAQLADNVVDTNFLHTNPSRDNYYWVVACNRDGCSEIDSDNPAAPIEFPPSNPQRVTYAVEDSGIRLSWEPVAGADHYNVYHDDFFDSACSLDDQRSASFCSELATHVVDTAFLHASPFEENHYWVVACNRGGCSEIDSRNPVTVTGSPPSPRATVEPAPPPTPDGSFDREPDTLTAPDVVHECPTTWEDSPTLTVAELLTACGGDASALAVRTTQECAAEDISAAGDQARSNAEQSRQNAADARERAAEAAADGNEDLAEHYEDLAQHHLDLALDAENRERDRRGRVMASRGATTWEQACETMVNRVWAADYTQAASLGRAFLTHLAILGDLICGGPNADHTDLCGGIDLLNVLEGSLDALTQGIESVAGLIETATDFFL